MPDAPRASFSVRAMSFSKANAVVVAEIEFGHVALEVRRADVLINASDGALEDRKVVLASVHGRAAAHEFASVVLDGEMTSREIGGDASVVAGFIPVCAPPSCSQLNSWRVYY